MNPNYLKLSYLKLCTLIVSFLVTSPEARAIRYNIKPVTLSEGYSIGGGFIETNGQLGVHERDDIVDYLIPILGPEPFGFSPSKDLSNIFLTGVVATSKSILVLDDEITGPDMEDQDNGRNYLNFQNSERRPEDQFGRTQSVSWGTTFAEGGVDESRISASNRGHAIADFSSLGEFLTSHQEIVVATASTPRAKYRLNVDFTDPPEIVEGQFPFGFSSENPFPEDVHPMFLLGEGTPDGSVTSYGIDDVISVDFSFGDAVFTVSLLQEFNLKLLADGTIESLKWGFGPITTPSVTYGIILMNSPLHITGTTYDTTTDTNVPFSYSYATSMETITAVPEPSTLAICFGLGLVGAFRRRRK